MTDLAKLVLEVEAADVDAADDSLGRFTNQARRAEVQTEKTNQRTAQFAKGARIAAGAAVALGGATAGLTAKLIANADQMAKNATRANVTAEEYQQLAFIAEQGGTSVGQLGDALTRANRRLANAATGAGPAIRAVRELGINIEEVTGAGGVERFALLVDELNAVSDTATRAQLAYEIFGDNYKQLIPLIEGGAASIRENAEMARRLGAVLSDETAAAAEQASDRLGVLQTAGKGLQTQFMEGLIPSINNTLGAMADLATESAEAGDQVSAMEQAGEVAAHGLNIGLRAAVALAGGVQIAGKAVGLLGANLVTLAQLMATAIDKQLENTGKRFEMLISGDFAGLVRSAAGEFAAIPALLDDAKGRFEALNAEGLGDISADVDGLFNQLTRLSNAMDDTGKSQEELEEKTNGAGDAAEVQQRTLTEVADSLEAYQKSLQGLQAQYQPTEAAQRALNSQLANARQLLGEKMITTDEYANFVRLLVQEYGDATRAGDSLTQTLEQQLAVIDREIAAYQQGADALAEFYRQQQIEQEIQRAGLELGSEEAAQLRERLELLYKLQDAQRDADAGGGAGGRGPAYRSRFNLADEVAQAFSDGNLSEFYNSLQENTAEAFNQGAQFLANATAAFDRNDSDVRAVAEIAASLPGPIGQIAQGVMALDDALFGGRLLGTDYETVGSGVRVSAGPGGVSGAQFQNQERERSFFRGTARRTIENDLDAQFARDMERLIEGIEQSMAAAGRQLGVEVPQLIAGEFEQEFDADGNLVSSVSTILGRTFEESLEEFQQRLSAENLLAVVGEQFEGVDQLAEQFRNDAGELLDAARLFVAAGRNIADGSGLFDSLEETLGVVQELGYAGEGMADTYVRLRQATEALTEASELLGFTLEGTQREIVTFAADIAEAAGGVDRARELWSAFFEGFYSDTERAAMERENAERRASDELADVGLDPTTTAEAFRDAFNAALAQGLSAEAVVEWLEAGEALAAALELQDQLTAALNEYANMAAAVGEELALSGLSDFQREIAEIELARIRETEALNEAARAAGLQAAREEDLARVHELAAGRAAQAIAQLEQQSRALVADLFGTPLTRVEAQIQALQEESRETERALGGVAGGLREVSSGLQQFGEDLLTGEFSPLNSAERLAESMRQLEAASRAGDAQRVQQLATQTLGIARDRFASGEGFANVFEDVQNLVAGTRERSRAAGPPTAEAIGSAVSSELAELLEQRDELLAEEQARQDFLTGQQLAQNIADLATARGETFDEVADLLGVDLGQLAQVLQLGDQSIEALLESLQQDGAAVASEIVTQASRIVAAINALGGRLGNDGGFTVPVPELGPIAPPPRPGPGNPSPGPRIPPNPGPDPRVPRQPNDSGTVAAVNAMRAEVTAALATIAANTGQAATGTRELARTVSDNQAARSRTINTGVF